ncbi:MAG: GNAT family N-acetyltransferase, partial [Chloroflexota bacterium]
MLRFNLHTYRNVDAAQVVAVINAASRASGVAFTITEKELAARQAAPGFDIDRDTSIVEAPGQGVIAYAEANLRQADDCIYYLTQAWVHPRFCGQGIGHALLERMWQQLQDICTVAEHKPGVLGAAVQDSQANAMKLFEKFSMRAVRYFNLMQRDLSLPIPPVELASGIRMCSWAERRNDQAIWAAHG